VDYILNLVIETVKLSLSLRVCVVGFMGGLLCDQWCNAHNTCDSIRSLLSLIRRIELM